MDPSNDAIKKYLALLTDDPLEVQYEALKKFTRADESLTDYEKYRTEMILRTKYDRVKTLMENSDKVETLEKRKLKRYKRICDDCQEQCLAILSCEICIRNYLKLKFYDWTSGNDDIDDLIQECQIEASSPDSILEWIPYDDFENIKYLTEGGFSKIYTADWIDGCYQSWDDKNRQLRRSGKQEVILKTLDKLDNNDKRWLDEGKYSLAINKKGGYIVQCYGLTRNPSDGIYMLVMRKMDKDLREHLQQRNYDKFTWKEKIDLVHDIAVSLIDLHCVGIIHRDLHPGNILFTRGSFQISDLGFCGPVNKPLNGLYGNLPYMAPELFKTHKYTFKTDIYSIAMLMWEISSGKPPFENYDFNDNGQVRIFVTMAIKGMRPEIVPGTPSDYKELMEECWNAVPEERPDFKEFFKKIDKMRKPYYNENKIDSDTHIENDCTKTTSELRSSMSKVYTTVGNLPEPKNATEEEQKVFHSALNSKNLGITALHNIDFIEAIGSFDIKTFNIITSHDNDITANKTSDISAPHDSKASEIMALHDSKTSDVSVLHDNKTSDISAPHDSKTSDISTPNDSKTSDVSASHDNKPSDISAPHDSKISDVSASHDNKPSDISAPYDNKTSDISAPHDSKTSDVSVLHDNKTSEISAPHDSKTSDISTPNDSKISDVSASHDNKPSDISAPHDSKTSDVSVLYDNKTSDISAPHDSKTSDISTPNDSKTSDVSASHDNKPSDISAPHDSKTSNINDNKASDITLPYDTNKTPDITDDDDKSFNFIDAFDNY